ncbi:MAG: hypothetical protein K0R75_3515 [Paenibacillaceae bacterium]|nr:hypothetical protein [Paenibacillaceae bacterium]
MFDPTIFDNMKVVLEGAVYDLDLSGKFVVTDRVDRIELSTMSRTYSIQFCEQGKGECHAEIALEAGISDLAAELMQVKNSAPGCLLAIRFRHYIRSVEDCLDVGLAFEDIWQGRPSIHQTISFVYDPMERPKRFMDLIELQFDRKLDEAQIDDFPELVRHVVISLQKLNQLSK